MGDLGRRRGRRGAAGGIVGWDAFKTAGLLGVHALPAYRFLTTDDDEERLLLLGLARAVEKERDRLDHNLAARIGKVLGG